jgi:hypothetical protein
MAAHLAKRTQMGGLMALCRACWLGLSLHWLVACSPPAPPAPSAPSETSSIQINDTVKTLAGGWTQADSFKEDVQEAARFAVQKQAVLTQSRLIYKDVLSAQTQIIAGLNFQLKVSVTEQDLPRYARVTVWLNLQNQYSLTQWDWTND